ncbi:hypothetical protein F511_42032 [Dorcoceras hygrometricum]|uniref:CCHC-type domain-containing protein n=1 Tax=Dorcoceras hygrometricum TaxID=472368 RepID=A0A2Z7AH61_9LAMI|nr:hypothetical protein F511_42032 [Dorcoceras hygrometricum]
MPTRNQVTPPSQPPLSSTEQAKRPFSGPPRQQLQGTSRLAEKPVTSGRPQNQQAPKPEVPVEKPTCQTWGCQHSGKCLMGDGVCLKCKQPGHLSYQCPQMEQPTTGRVYVMQAEEADPDTTLIIADAPLCPAGLPEEPAKANHRPKQPKNREKKRGQTSANNSAGKSHLSLNTTHNQSDGRNHRFVIFRSIDHHKSVVFRHDDSAGHHLDDSIGPFRRNNSTGRSQCLLDSGHQSNIRLNMYA